MGGRTDPADRLLAQEGLMTDLSVCMENLRAIKSRVAESNNELADDLERAIRCALSYDSRTSLQEQAEALDELRKRLHPCLDSLVSTEAEEVETLIANLRRASEALEAAHSTLMRLEY